MWERFCKANEKLTRCLYWWLEALGSNFILEGLAFQPTDTSIAEEALAMLVNCDKEHRDPPAWQKWIVTVVILITVTCQYLVEAGYGARIAMRGLVVADFGSLKGGRP